MNKKQNQLTSDHALRWNSGELNYRSTALRGLFISIITLTVAIVAWIFIA
jgi:hypothetical protein